MTLDFPNESRSYDAKRNLVRFWGYDSALEISLFVEASALRKLNPLMENGESGCLKAFLLIRATPPVGMYVLNMFCMRGSRLWGSRLHRACVV